MKIILKESQVKKLEEITVFRSTYAADKSYEYIFSEFEDEKRFLKVIKYYLKNVLGFTEKKLTIDFLTDYRNYLTKGNPEGIPKILKNEDIKSNLAYFVVIEFGKLKKLGNLLCYKTDLHRNYHYYFFFDKDLKESIGYIAVEEPDKIRGIKFPSGTKQVAESYLDSELIGSGVGKEMYLSVLDDVEILLSDTILSNKSLNIWVNVLPRFVNVGVVTDDDYYSNKIVKQLSVTSKNVKHSDVDCYFATKSNSVFRRMLEKN
jgi:hypothetical protein